MERKRIEKLVVLLLIGILIPVSLFPFHVNAQSLSAPFLGINMQVTAYGENASSITLPKYNIEYIGSTVPSGYISGQLNCTTPASPSSSTPCDVFSFQNTSGQSGTGNGTRLYLNLQNYLLEANGNATINHQSYFFIDYEFILDDNYKGYVTFTDSDNNTKTVYVNGNQFHYSRMQLSISEVTITIDDYELTRVYDPLFWDIPYEFIPYISDMFYYGYQNIGFDEYNNWHIPLFQFQVGDYIARNYFYSNSRSYARTFIIVSDKLLNYSNISNYINVSNGSVWDTRTIGTGYYYNYYVVTIGVPSSAPSDGYITLSAKAEFKGTPLYFGFSTDGTYNFSNDVAIALGLNNKFLKNIDLLANGNTASNSSASNLDDTTSQFSSDSNDLVTIEESFNDSMNNALQNVSPSFNMGQSFLNSANWVSQQFNRIVNNTPFASLITFGLTLGLGLLIIGKVRK